MALGIWRYPWHFYFYFFPSEGNTDARAEASDLIIGLLEAAVPYLLRNRYLCSQLY